MKYTDVIVFSQTLIINDKTFLLEDVNFTEGIFSRGIKYIELNSMHVEQLSVNSPSIGSGKGGTFECMC